MARWAFVLSLFIAAAEYCAAQTSSESSAFVIVNDPVFVINHVRVIDGTGAPPKDDQAVVVANGKISSITLAAALQPPAGARVLERSGYTVIPGLTGMHDHLFYTDAYSTQVDPSGRVSEPGFFLAEVAFSAPRLYLASGVTTIRTTGSVEPYTDLKLKQRIDEHSLPGPALDFTAPYLEGPASRFAQMHELTGPEDARRLVLYWAAEGATSYKAYMNITREELAAAVDEAHSHHAKVTGHLCSVTWHEAIRLGIDDLEHGPVFTDTDFVADKKPDLCPRDRLADSWANLNINGPQVSELIHDLVVHHVAVTSTLPVFEARVPGRPKMQQRVLDAMSPQSIQSYLVARAGIPMNSPSAALFRKEMDFEVAFVKAGGLLLAGPDPTGIGGVLPGFGDQREIELLVEAGFTPVQAVQIGTANGARYLGRQDRIGTLLPGKQADIVLIKGDPAAHIDEIENVEIVFKTGIGYDSAKLIESVRGQVGTR